MDRVRELLECLPSVASEGADLDYYLFVRDRSRDPPALGHLVRDLELLASDESPEELLRTLAIDIASETVRSVTDRLMLHGSVFVRGEETALAIGSPATAHRVLRPDGVGGGWRELPGNVLSIAGAAESLAVVDTARLARPLRRGEDTSSEVFADTIESIVRPRHPRSFEPGGVRIVLPAPDGRSPGRAVTTRELVTALLNALANRKALGAGLLDPLEMLTRSKASFVATPMTATSPASVSSTSLGPPRSTEVPGYPRAAPPPTDADSSSGSRAQVEAAELLSSHPRRRAGVAESALDTELLVQDTSSGRVLLLNLIAAATWDLCGGDLSTTEISEELGRAFGLDEASARKATVQSLCSLDRNGMIDW